jgi:hypothetical protein
MHEIFPEGESSLQVPSTRETVSKWQAGFPRGYAVKEANRQSPVLTNRNWI